MAQVKWIKICTDIFDDEKILLIESMPEADSIIVIWFKLLCMSGKQNNKGIFMLNDKIAYTDEMLATIFRRPLNTVRLALKTFENYGMIEIIDDVITIPNWDKHQSLDSLEKKKEYDRQYQAEKRLQQKLMIEEKNRTTSYDENTTVVSLDKDKEIVKELEKEKENILKEKKKYGELGNVLLTDEELQKLKEKFPNDYLSRIDNLSYYIAQKGKKYKSHYATILTWSRNENNNNNNTNTNTTNQKQSQSWGASEYLQKQQEKIKVTDEQVKSWENLDF